MNKEINEWMNLSFNEQVSNDDLVKFAKARFDGARNIIASASDKGGFALLTKDHFKVKLPHYEKAKSGHFNKNQAKEEYKRLCNKLHSHMNSIEKMSQKEFQQLVGKIEVLGELLIQNQDV